MRSEPGGAGPRFRARVEGFLEYLRARGFRAGVGAELDWARAAASIDLLDRTAFRAATVVTLAKSPEDVRVVRAAFDRYWGDSELADPAADAESERATLAPRPKEPPSSPKDRKGPEGDRPSPVVIPLGTYSASAPSLPHPIEALGEREVRALRRGVRRFRREMANYPGRRHGPAHRGYVDLRDTVRHSLRHGGEWFELRHRTPRISRAELLILWDVSGSMREHESRFFALVHALESTSRRSRVFAFSTEVREITADVRRSGYRRAAADVARRIDRADGGTRIGRSLGEFSERYGSSMRPGTTLVVLSDGWDLGEADRVGEELGRLRRRGGRVVWVTPYTRRPGFQARVGALRAALGHLDRLLGPEDFESAWPLRPFVG